SWTGMLGSLCVNLRNLWTILVSSLPASTSLSAVRSLSAAVRAIGRLSCFPQRFRNRAAPVPVHGQISVARCRTSQRTKPDSYHQPLCQLLRPTLQLPQSANPDYGETESPLSPGTNACIPPVPGH